MTGTGTYPSVANPGLQGKIALKKEFAYKYEGKIEEIASKTKSICMAGSSFELAPHQEFVKRFMSYDTPYNSLLLYHGLGSGKTCSASTMTETLRTYSNMPRSGVSLYSKSVLVVLYCITWDRPSSPVRYPWSTG